MTDREIHPPPVIVTLPSHINAANAEQATEQISRAFTPGVTVVIADLTSAACRDRSAIRHLLKAHRKATARGRQVRFVIRPGGPLHRITEFADIHPLLAVYPTLQRAMTGGAPTSPAPPGARRPRMTADADDPGRRPLAPPSTVKRCAPRFRPAQTLGPGCCPGPSAAPHRRDAPGLRQLNAKRRHDGPAGRPRRQAVLSPPGCRASRPGVPGCVRARLQAGLVPGKMRVPRGRWAQVPGIRYPLMINGVAVVSAPAEIDVTTAGQLRMVLLDAAGHGHAAVVVDLTRTRFCDSAGLAVLAGAHRRARAQGGGVRLVLPADGAVARILSFTGLDGFIPGFGSLEPALAPGPAAAIPASRPAPSPLRRSPPRRPGRATGAR